MACVLRWPHRGGVTLLTEKDPDPETLVFGCAHALLTEHPPTLAREEWDDAHAVRTYRFDGWAYVRSFIWPFMTGSTLPCPRAAAIRLRREMGLRNELTLTAAFLALREHAPDVVGVTEDLDSAYLLRTDHRRDLPADFPRFALLLPESYTRAERVRASVALLAQGISLPGLRGHHRHGVAFGVGAHLPASFREGAAWGERFAEEFMRGAPMME